MKFLTATSPDIEDALSSILPSSGNTSDKPGLLEALSSWDSLKSFFAENQVMVTLILALLAGILIACMLIRKHKIKNPPDPLKTLGADALFQLEAGLLIICLAASDLFAMYNMFSNFRLKPEESIIFSITFAMFLEGFPFALGFIDPLKKDPAQFIMQRGRRYRFLSTICWIFLIASWALALLIRFLYTEQPSMGGFAAFYNGIYNSGRNKYSNNAFLAQVFLYVSPILTSILAYVLSYLAFGSSCVQEAAKMLRAAHKRYNAKQEAYNLANHHRLDATAVLWSSLSGDPNSKPPVEFNDFRNKSMVYIHDMLVDGCLDTYPALLKRYNHEVEAALARYIAELSHLSSVPHIINQISVEEITQSYDARMTRDVDKWEYELCEPAMCADLEQLLNDAVIGAQFKALKKK